jgi:hypothetical protein
MEIASGSETSSATNPMVFLTSMQPDKLLYPALFHDGQAYFLERADTHTGAYFGGPIEDSITGIKHGPHQIHHIATLNGHCFQPLWDVIGAFQLKLLYGMCYSGCHLKYGYSSVGLEILEMTPHTSAMNWPYPDYPTHLPYFPLRLQQHSKCSLEKFLALSCQPIKVASSETLVLVPPSPVLGMSLWGPSGDGENTQIVFRCDLAKKTVEAYNQCG